MYTNKIVHIRLHVRLVSFGTECVGGEGLFQQSVFAISCLQIYRQLDQLPKTLFFCPRGNFKQSVCGFKFPLGPKKNSQQIKNHCFGCLGKPVKFQCCHLAASQFQALLSLGHLHNDDDFKVLIQMNRIFSCPDMTLTFVSIYKA